jgi:hypothetical protein
MVGKVQIIRGEIDTVPEGLEFMVELLGIIVGF